MHHYRMTNDMIFKYVFGRKQNEKILRSLLNAILGVTGDERIAAVEILNPINFKEYPEDKLTILDIKATDQAGRLYNIEMQINPESHFINRIIYYHDRLFVDQLNDGETYDLLKKTFSISILDYTLLPEETELHNIYRYRNLNSGKELTDIKELHFIELAKYDADKPRSLSTSFEKWLNALKFSDIYAHEDAILPNEIASEEEIVMAIKSMRQALADKEFREMINFREKARLDELYRRNQDLAAAEMKGKLEGILEGKLEGKLDVAARMLKSGLKPEQIADFTGLNLEEIHKLIH